MSIIYTCSAPHFQLKYICSIIYEANIWYKMLQSLLYTAPSHIWGIDITCISFWYTKNNIQINIDSNSTNIHWRYISTTFPYYDLRSVDNIQLPQSLLLCISIQIKVQQTWYTQQNTSLAKLKLNKYKFTNIHKCFTSDLIQQNSNIKLWNIHLFHQY